MFDSSSHNMSSFVEQKFVQQLSSKKSRQNKYRNNFLFFKGRLRATIFNQLMQYIPWHNLCQLIEDGGLQLSLAF